MRKINKKVVKTVKKHPVISIAVVLSFTASLIGILGKLSKAAKNLDFSDDLDFDDLDELDDFDDFYCPKKHLNKQDIKKYPVSYGEDKEKTNNNE